MTTIFYENQGEICIHYASWPRYIGYTKREAFQRFRKDYGLVGKHIKFIDIADGYNFMQGVHRLIKLKN